MKDRVIIRAHRSKVASVLATLVFGGLGAGVLWLGLTALWLGEFGGWVWGLLALGALFVWAAIHAVWAGFGIDLIVTRGGLRRIGPFRGMKLARDGLRIGRHDGFRSNMRGGGDTQGAVRSIAWTQIWALTPDGHARLVWEGPGARAQAGQVIAAVEDLLGLPLEPMTAEGQAGFAPVGPGPDHT